MSRTPPAASPPAPTRGLPLATALLVLTFATVTGCGGGHGTLVVGVRPERPGLADRLPTGGYAGFEIDVAGYVARRLGYRDDQVSYVELGPTDGGRADLTMGVPLAKGQTAGGPLSGPYLVSGQDILTSANDLSVRRLKDLTQKRVCTGSPGPLVSRFGVAWQRAFLITSTVKDCVRMLAARRVNAVTDDAVVLAGLAGASPGRFRLVGHTFSRDKYGIALRADSGDLHAQVDEALRTMFGDGSWRRAVIEHLGLLAAKYATPPALEKYSGTRSAP
ncbi:transporter substrate-binding domain-containing protein [Sphaerisporangium sp. NPDC049002]|uniref:transporter substrate-binding domain-containing protein n=1 Tax=unclassified Sphaerisporangium TaxID=2630420 RepID=UPI0033EEE160